MYLADDDNETLHVYSALSCPKGCDKSVNILVLPTGTLRPGLSSAKALNEPES